MGLLGLRRALQEFRKLDPDIRAVTVMVFLEVALDEGTTTTAIAEKLGLHLPTTSRYVAQLGEFGRGEKKGLDLIEPREERGDRRFKGIYLTPKGRAVADSLKAYLGG